MRKLTEAKFNKIINEVIGQILKPDTEHVIECAKESLEKTIENFKTVQAMLYNIDMEEETDKIMGLLYELQSQLEGK